MYILLFSVDVVKVDGPQINTSSILSTTTTDFSQQLRETSSELSPEPPSKLRGRVKSILEPDLFSSPEMLILTGAEQQVVAPVLNEHVLTGDHRFPDGSRQVTILRGDAGFGITLVEGKVSVDMYYWALYMWRIGFWLKMYVCLKWFINYIQWNLYKGHSK